MRGVTSVFLLIFAISSFVKAQLPSPELKAVILMKVAELERNVSKEGRQVQVHVMGAPELATALTKFKGKNIGNAVLADVSRGEGLPSKRVDILFVGTNNGLKDVITYARKNQVMTVTDRADLFHKGLSVSIVMEKRRPKISLNPGASLKEGLDFNLDFSRFQSLTLEFKKGR